MSSMPFQQEPEHVTQRERELYQQEKESYEMQAQHALKMKELELQIVEKETRWSNWQKIPLTLIKLPALVILSFGFLFKKDVPPEFWALFGVKVEPTKEKTLPKKEG